MKKYTRAQLKAMKVKSDLLPLAKELGVIGRHDMNKQTLIENVYVKLNAKNAITKVASTTINNIEVADIAAKYVSAFGEDSPSFEKFATKPKREIKSKQMYQERAQIGQLVAFKVHNTKAFSGKIVEMRLNKYVIETKNGVKYTIVKERVVWYKVDRKWPRWVYNLLKGIK